MAKIQEEIYVIRVSKLIRNEDEKVESITDNDFESNIQALTQELCGSAVIVEVEKA